MLAVGWVFVPESEINCPSYLQTMHQEQVRLRPGESVVINVDELGGGPASKHFHYCVKVTDLQIMQ